MKAWVLAQSTITLLSGKSWSEGLNIEEILFVKEII